VCLVAKLDRRAAGLILEVARANIVDLILLNQGTAPPPIDESWLRGQGPTSAGHLLHKLVPRIELLPALLRQAILRLFSHSINLPATAAEFSIGCDASLCSTERHLADADFASPRRMLNVARLSRVWAPMMNMGRTLDNVAQVCGYTDVRTLSLHCRELLDLTSTEIRAHVEHSEFVRRLELATTI
jgi:AraC-like DNA-binding protein